MKKLLAFLLALAMVFSLAACGGGKDDGGKDGGSSAAAEADTLDDSKAENGDATIGVDAVEQYVGARSLKHWAKLAGGGLCADEVYNFLKAYVDFEFMEEDELISRSYMINSFGEDGSLKEYEEYEVSESMQKGYQDDLDRFLEYLDGEIEAFEAGIEEMSDEDWASRAEYHDMSAAEYQKLATTLLDAAKALRDAVKDASVADGTGYTLFIENGDTDDTFLDVFLNDGAWFTSELFHLRTAVLQFVFI